MKFKMTDRKWIAIIVFALILEVLWLLTDLQWLKIPFLSKPAVTTGQIEAGYVVKSKSDLKRRGGNSLVWEPAKEKDILYYKDSVLTLAQSAAKLYLNDKTELDLAENTLVTLEQPEDNTQAEIRLRFAKGDMKARNPNAKAKIEGGDWVVNLEKGAEVSLRKDEKDNYEFEVLSGKASLETEKGVENLQDSKILKLGENNQIEQIEKSKELAWADSKPQRLYTFENEAEVPVEWAGPARQLQITKPGADETRQALAAGQQSAKIKLPTGSYKLRLSDESGLSAAKEVEVFNAPKIFPKKPLPRDRLVAGAEQEFVWSSEAGVTKYEITISGKFGVIKRETADNFIKIGLEDENQDATWSVHGVDEDGNKIPALQENKIFIRRDPLAAPKLKTPELREVEEPQQSKPGAFHWWHLFLKTAHAAQSIYEINFEWEAVEGAEHYTVEISTDPEFKSPEVSTQTKAKSFKWNNFKPQKKYYWRVAAGSARRMGVFTEATEVKPVKITRPSKAELAAKAEAEAKAVAEAKAKLEADQKIEAEVETKARTEAEAAQAQSEKSVAEEKPFIFGIALMPTFKIVSAPVDSSSKANLTGGSPLGIQFEYQKSDYHFRINGTSQLWKPSPESEFPLQQSLQIPEAWAFLNKGAWGLAIHQGFIAKRETVGSIATEPHLHLGIRYVIAKKVGISGLLGGDSNELALDYVQKYYLSDTSKDLRFYLGGGIHFFYQATKEGSGTNTNLNLLIGADSF